MKHTVLILAFLTTVAPVAAQTEAESKQSDQKPSVTKSKQKPRKGKSSKWVALFNGKDLKGWIPKIRHHKVGENFGNTFRVVNGLLRVSYDQYQGNFDQRFGHLFYKDKFSHYILRVEYRFVGEQMAGGPDWAWRNSGVMIHGEDPRGMAVGQDFPTSIEVQLLGGRASGDRPTANLCTPGTHIIRNGKPYHRHCTNSKSKTYRGDQWVTVEIEVHGGKLIRHKVNGKSVMEYEQPHLDKKQEKLIAKNGGKPLLTGGTISLQSESHPLEFRKVEIMILPEGRQEPGSGKVPAGKAKEGKPAGGTQP